MHWHAPACWEGQGRASYLWSRALKAVLQLEDRPHQACTPTWSQVSKIAAMVAHQKAQIRLL